jgi:hypothetical protein
MPEQLEDLYENAVGFEASIELPAAFRRQNTERVRPQNLLCLVLSQCLKRDTILLGDLLQVKENRILPALIFYLSCTALFSQQQQCRFGKVVCHE